MKKGKNIELLSPAHTNHLRCNKTIATQHCREKLQRPELPLCRSVQFWNSAASGHKVVARRCELQLSASANHW